MKDYVDLLPVAVEAARLAGDLMKSRPPGALTPKGDRDVASETDYLIERRVRTFLSAETPEIGFWGEEDGITGDGGELLWACDPIDGTVNFIHGIPMCAFSLGLMLAGRPILGVINLPFLDVEYGAVENHGAFANSRRISVSKASDISKAVVGVGDYAVGQDADQKNKLRFAVTQQLANSVQRIRMNGSVATDLSWLAEGRLDASVTLANNPWDIAAGVVIAREAGADVLDLDGSEHNLGSRATVAAAPGISAELIALLHKAEESGSAIL